MEGHEIFISYSRRDYDVVKSVSDSIERLSGVKCWMDLDSIEAGSEEFSKEIIQGINACQVFLFMLSPRSQESEYALRELRFARKKGKRTILVEIDDCLLNDYFDFNFGASDIIRWNDVLQREKLIRDLMKWVPVKGNETAEPEPDLKFNVKGVEFKMVKVEEGSFWMGADSGVRLVKKRGLYRDVEIREVNTNVQNFDGDALDDEKPVHVVNLSSYYMGETLVTQALWKAVMGSNPSCWKGDNLPVEKVNWNDCQLFISKLNRLTGKDFRLPTEAEWEFAALGGPKGSGGKAMDEAKFGSMAWYEKNSGGKTHAVKGKSPNELGLYDMFGNVWEWCGDWYGGYGMNEQTNPRGSSRGSHRVMRGGSWRYNASRCRVTRRSFGNPDYGFNDYGFRLALPL